MSNRFKASYLWLLVAGISGLVIALIITSSMTKYQDLVTVYTASEDLKVDWPISKERIVSEQWPRHLVPEDAITDPADVDGKYASTTILKGQIVKKAAIADASTLRELVRKYGMEFGTLTIPLEQSDIPVEQIHVGDTINLIGTFTKGGGKDVKSTFVAENVPVIDVVNDTKSGVGKISIAIKRSDALLVTRDLAMGKIRVMLDPRAFDPNTPKYTGDANAGETDIGTGTPTTNVNTSN